MLDLRLAGLELPGQAEVQQGFTVADGLKKAEQNIENVNNALLEDSLLDPLGDCLDFIDKIDEPKPINDGKMIASEEDIREIGIDTSDTKVQRLKEFLYVPDLSKKLTDPHKTKSVYQKSQLYLGMLFIVSIFYSLPVLQMVFRFSAEQSMTGNQENF